MVVISTLFYGLGQLLLFIGINLYTLSNLSPDNDFKELDKRIKISRQIFSF